MEILNDVARSFEYYFNALSYLGYKRQEDTNRLLIYDFYSRLLEEYEVPEEDYKLIGRALHCLYGRSCLIPYPTYKKEHSITNIDLIISEPQEEIEEPEEPGEGGDE